MTPKAVALIFLALLVGLAYVAAAGPAGVPEEARAADIDGTDGDDILDGTDGYDEIRGFDGDDELRGLGGPDNLYGNANADYLRGGPGDDALYGGNGHDYLNVASDDSGGDYAGCGDGDDTVRADPSDAISLNCETIVWIF